DGERAGLVRRRGEAVLRVRVDPSLRPGVAFAPFHWGALHAPPGAGTVNAATNGAEDPVSSQPELKACAARVERLTLPRRRAAGPAIVVVGGGMSALAVVEEVLRRRPGERPRVTILAEEARAPYRRLALSRLLAGHGRDDELELWRPASYRERGIDVRTGCPAVHLDLRRREIVDARGARHRYDRLVLATGS